MPAPSRQDAKGEPISSALCALAAWRELFLFFTHDADGNLLSDGRWTYQYDGENRVVWMNRSNLVTEDGEEGESYFFYYDSEGQRYNTWQTMYGEEGGDCAILTIYDGWEPVAEFEIWSGRLLLTYVWGLDVSGTRHGAAGVGGLLMAELLGLTALPAPLG